MGSKRKRGNKDTALPGQIGHKRAKNGDSPSAKSEAVLTKAPFVEAPVGEDRKREGALYDLLGSEDESERLQAADCIISSLLGDEKVPEPVLQRHLDRRLFRGLASGRNASRIGFSLVITEILEQLFGLKDLAAKQYPGLSFLKVLSYLVDKTKVAGNLPGQEERDHFFGQLFGIECFVRSGVLFQDQQRWDTVLDQLLSLGSKKVWLRSQCGWVIMQAMNMMNKKQAEGTLQKITDAGMAKTPEGVAVWIAALRRFPDLKVKPWAHPLAKKSLGELSLILKESFRDSDPTEANKSRQPNKQANWTAQLHFVWDIILDAYLQGAQSGQDDLDQFWSRVVDDGLFSKSATDGQKFKGFAIFQKFLEGLSAKTNRVGVLFTKHLVACLMNQAAKEDRYVHRAAVKALRAIESSVSSRPAILPEVLDSLLGPQGAYNFDQRTNTKTVDKLLQNIGPDNEAQIMEVVQKPISKLDAMEVGEAQSILRSYIDYLSKALSASPAQEGNPALASASALLKLSELAYCKPNIPSDVLTEQMKELSRTRLQASLAKMTRKAEEFGVFCNAILSIDSSSISMDDAIRSAVDQARSRMQRLMKHKTKTEEEKGLNQGLAMLHAVSVFQLYNEDPDAMEVLSDLEQYEDRHKTGAVSDSSSELLVEILLSMVARPSSLMRHVSQQVFEAFTSHVSAEGLELLTGPLGSDESTRGRQELFNTEDEDMEVDGDEVSDDEGDEEDTDNVLDVEDASDFEMDSDVEFVGLNDKGAGDDESGDVDDEDGDDDDEDGDDDEEDDAKKDKANNPQDLDELVGQILRSHRLDKDEKAESSDSDGDMSDSQMLALDDKLAEVFKNRARARPDSKKDKKDAKQSVVNFKHRILDLLDIYVKNEPLNPLTLSLLTPLLNMMRTTSTKALANRACEIILNHQKGMRKARSNNKEDGNTVEADDILLALLVEIHAVAGKDNSHAYARAASAASLIVASTMFAADRDLVKQMAAVYAKTQSDWVLGEARMQSSFFADWNNWCQNQASQTQQVKGV